MIGDKRAAGTVKYLCDHPGLLSQLITWSPLPIKVVRCVRNPLDVIATRTWRNELELETNLERYFYLEEQAERIANVLNISNAFHVYNEELIANPTEVIRNLLDYLGLDQLENHIEACRKLIYPSPNQSRSRVDWNQQLVDKINQRIGQLPHLHKYANSADLD